MDPLEYGLSKSNEDQRIMQIIWIFILYFSVDIYYLKMRKKISRSFPNPGGFDLGFNKT